MLAAGGFVAVGETGLDDVIPRADLDAQERVFRTQAGLAREAGLPLIIHVRGAFDRLVRALESVGPGGPGGVLHAFGGSAEVAARLRRLGYLRGVGGGVTRPEAVKVRAAVAAAPLDALVLETDAPYIGTRRRPKGTVEPADVADVRDAVAALRGVAPEEVEARTSAAARTLFRLGP
jgi:TatD DNase family protein